MIIPVLFILFVLIPSQVRLLVEIENSLPKYILERVQVYSHTEYPNYPKTMRQAVSVEIYFAFALALLDCTLIG